MHADFSIKCRECHAVNTLSKAFISFHTRLKLFVDFVKDIFPKPIEFISAEDEEEAEFSDVVLQIECRGLVPRKYHVPFSGPFQVLMRTKTSSLPVQWSPCHADPIKKAQAVDLWEFYDVDPVNGHPISITEFYSCFNKKV
jgi:Eukaryotic protein of unknown function (DUF866)